MDGKSRSEIALIFLFVAVAIVFVVQTFSFRSGSATLFPRMTAAVVIFGGMLLLAENYLPESLRRVVAEPVDLVDRDEFEQTDEVTPATEPSDQTDESAVRWWQLTERQFLFAAVTGYVVGSYAFSILLATPLFVAGYGYWNNQRTLYVAVLVLSSVAICMVFISLANAPLDRGLLFPRGIL